MNKAPLLSIIIPVYNSEEYLGGCLQAILERQAFSDFELILIDDGSEDSSPQMCGGYAERYAQVRVIRKPNGGASSARNAGLREAAGKYILFVDADDYIEDFSLGKIAALIEAEEESDVVLLNSKIVLNSGEIKEHNNFAKHYFYKRTHEEVLEHFSVSLLPDCVWGKLIKRDVITENGIFFVEGIICEDVDFSIKLFMHAKTYNSGGFDYYYYRAGREGSVMNSRSSSNRTFIDLLFIITKWDALSESYYKEHIETLRAWNFMNYCWVLLPRYRKLARKEKREYKKGMDSLRHILYYSKSRRARLVRIAYRLFGAAAASWAAAVYSVIYSKITER